MPVEREKSTGASPFHPRATLACYWRQLPQVDICLPDVLGQALGRAEDTRLRHVAAGDTSANRTLRGNALSFLN